MRSKHPLHLLPFIMLLTGCQPLVQQNSNQSVSSLQPAEIKAYLTHHPEFTQDFYNNWQKKQAEIKHNRQQSHYNHQVQQLFNNSHFFTLGNPTANITLASFIDYSATASKHTLKILNQLITHNNNIRVIIIPITTSPLASTLTKLAFNADAQGKLNQFHNKLSQVAGLITNKDQHNIAKQLKLKTQSLTNNYQKITINYITSLKLQSLPSYIVGFSHQTTLRTPLTITGKTSLLYLQGLLKKYHETEKARLANVLKEKEQKKFTPAISVSEISTTTAQTIEHSA
ncbi:hypothetical protein AVI51_06345 [Piscirickettsia salmonis]|uniref:Uncharacterized protein n=1 Tax=Piscirickettsia salmonis TaxID=1238 RepID=A0A9Q5VBD8_PISSA|nr:hypothetical protein [Piscirickettsia salmonis]ALA25711.1 DSBA oxidoreductase [Piscirickettsia salmonis]APS46549.1 hypothetical protein AVI49_02175 [Piscirickettsia salmonis]APS50518.1 hypothetical protein AVI50_06415 [Piscirickettsia salmonis]APS53721.1 hypothetical protein AVI51_06345 [Piscirickettsia salmonis]APS56789.1 hypothetical protein AVI52_05700 [Piscirickettsia salmonis]